MQGGRSWRRRIRGSRVRGADAEGTGKCPDTWLLTMSTSFAAAKAVLVSAMSLAHPLPRAVLSRATDTSAPTPMSERSSSNSLTSTGSL
jgi:hypothetical protein